MRLELNTIQKTVLSPKMIQSAQILQMSAAQLYEYINILMEENPVIEIKNNDETNIYTDTLKNKIEYLDSTDEQNRTYYSQELEDEEENDMWKFAQRTQETLREYLLGQINVLKKSREEKQVCLFVAENIDNDGYLRISAEEISREIGCSEDIAKEAIKTIKSLEPAGVGAATVEECLLLQLERLEKRNLLAEKIIKSHIMLLAKNQIHIIAKKTNSAVNDVIDAISIIKDLNPKPSSGFAEEEDVEYIIPDAVIEGENGIYKVIINEKAIPEIIINDFYREVIKQSNDEKAAEYINDKINQALWVKKCILRRNNTLRDILRVITDRQKDFFDNGKGYLKPMTLADISEKLSVHESTVSRSINGKYIQCRHGVFSIGYFFSHKISVRAGDDISQDNLKYAIKELIENEDKNSPLSDRKIAECLSEKGMEISRRTVAKYRAELGINGISGRKI